MWRKIAVAVIVAVAVLAAAVYAAFRLSPWPSVLLIRYTFDRGAAETAAAIAPSARQLQIEPGLTRASLRGLLLYCGPYDPGVMNFDGPFGDFMRTVLWSYIGTRATRGTRACSRCRCTRM